MRCVTAARSRCRAASSIRGRASSTTALREAHEEIALSLDEVRVLGALTPLDIPVSGFRLHPIVAVNPTRPALKPSDGEVARILEVSLDELLDPQHSRRRNAFVTASPSRSPGSTSTVSRSGGATAMVLAEFLALLGWADQVWLTLDFCQICSFLLHLAENRPIVTELSRFDCNVSRILG
jgi:hypothetical protein